MHVQRTRGLFFWEAANACGSSRPPATCPNPSCDGSSTSPPSKRPTNTSSGPPAKPSRQPPLNEQYAQSTHVIHDTTHDTRHTTHDTRHTTHDARHSSERQAARSLWVASIRDFEDVLRWYGAADVFSSAARLDTDASVSSGAATAPDADDDSSSPEDHRSADSPERFPVANLERVLDYMARAIRHRCVCACARAFCHQSSHSFVFALMRVVSCRWSCRVVCVCVCVCVRCVCVACSL
jgi:hypothetical protein